VCRSLLFAAQVAVVSSATVLADSSSAGKGRIMVLAASSLTEVLQSVAKIWTEQGHPEVIFSFDATSRLAKQIEAGIAADIFFSADREWMDFLAQRDLLRAETRMELAGNQLVAIIPADSKQSISAPRDLARTEVTRLGLAGESVPAGKYARASLANLVSGRRWRPES